MTDPTHLQQVQSIFEATHDVHILAVFRDKLSLAGHFYKYMYAHAKNYGGKEK
eukprot:CAMPEP_0194059066 /NCGR_PEP_ID=MMETSP0009_2-20130614/68003_1 /TAXON_ID=210454 /ORGANISM="Grammatophora oceanica, Strain CCMP 410" /LENGTH=52 /DNA_ID=CAMNT_0038709435 /DNA_START=71 /DNA_END=226 /DNA_ORIENTATION=-